MAVDELRAAVFALADERGLAAQYGQAWVARALMALHAYERRPSKAHRAEIMAIIADAKPFGD